MRDANGRRVKADTTVLVSEARDRAKNLRDEMKAQPAKYSPGMRRAIKDDIPALCDLADPLAGEVGRLRTEAMAARFAESLNDCAFRNRSLFERVDELEGTLGFYADIGNYQFAFKGRAIEEDLGEKARAALSGGEGEGDEPLNLQPQCSRCVTARVRRVEPAKFVFVEGDEEQKERKRWEALEAVVEAAKHHREGFRPGREQSISEGVLYRRLDELDEAEREVSGGR